ncbi:MAG: metallophosphoesterase family protein, partial [Deltaproteobacteria bacterium]|nr:metallophosphoesterase family protein [Deltaproteobacteria bacterium]
MKLAVITDVHADVHALADALVQIDRLGCDAIVCAGDVLDWGLFPEETIELLRERRIATIRGNHDRWAVQEGRDATGWDLSAGATSWLGSLLPSWERTIEGVRVAVWHARPGSDLRGVSPGELTDEGASNLLDGAKAEVLIVGHT